MKLPREYREIVEEAQRQGWRIEETRKGIMLYAPGGAGSVLIHGTESDRHALHNTIARMRQRGFQWPPTKGAR